MSEERSEAPLSAGATAPEILKAKIHCSIGKYLSKETIYKQILLGDTQMSTKSRYFSSEFKLLSEFT